MSKLFSSIVFSFFLLFQTTSIADEETTPTEINTTEETESTEENKANILHHNEMIKKTLKNCQRKY